MIDINIIRKSPEIVKNELSKRNMRLDLDNIVKMDAKWRKTLQQLEQYKSEVKDASKEIAKLDGSKKRAAIAKQRKQSDSIKELDLEVKEIKNKLDDSLRVIPNITHDSVPTGKDERGNAVEKTWGEKPTFNFYG